MTPMIHSFIFDGGWTLYKFDLPFKGISWDEHETANGDGQTIATQVFKKGVIKVAASRDSSAFIIQSDLLATNGVVHVIDAVI